LKKGWALKENQKFGNKGGGTKFSKKTVTDFFMQVMLIRVIVILLKICILN